MKNVTLNTVSALAFVFAGSVVVAQADWDTDGDGAYSFEELVTALPDLTAESYAELDSDGDGFVGAEEMAAAVETGMIIVDG